MENKSLKLQYLLPLFSEDELEYVEGGWDVTKIASLEVQKNVYSNLKLLKNSVKDTDEEQLLKYAIFFSNSFSSPTERFVERMKLFMEEFENWEEIIEQQFWNYFGFTIAGTDDETRDLQRFLLEDLGPTEDDTKPILLVMGFESDDMFSKALDEMKHPETMHWNLFDFLTDMCGKRPQIEKSFVSGDISEYLDLETNGWLVYCSLEMLLNNGLCKEAACCLAEAGIYILKWGEEYTAKKLKRELGNRYISTMNRLWAEGKLEERLTKINQKKRKGIF